MEEKLFYSNSKGNKLCGILSNPSNNKNRPVIILVHGFNSGKNSGSNTALVKELNKNNISYFRIDLFAHGESEGKFEDLTVSEAVDDILQAIKKLQKIGYKRIGLEGSSFGGLAAFIAASKTESLYLLAVKCPVSSYLEFSEYANPGLINEWKKQGYNFRENKKLKYSFYEDVIKNIAYDIAKDIKIPTLIVHGGSDNEVPVSQSIKMSQLIKNCRLHIIPEAGHMFQEGNSKEEMIRTIVDFIIKNS